MEGVKQGGSEQEQEEEEEEVEAKIKKQEQDQKEKTESEEDPNKNQEQRLGSTCFSRVECASRSLELGQRVCLCWGKGCVETNGRQKEGKEEGKRVEEEISTLQ